MAVKGVPESILYTVWPALGYHFIPSHDLYFFPSAQLKKQQQEEN